MPIDMKISISGDKEVLAGLTNLQTNMKMAMVNEVEAAAQQTKDILYSEAPIGTGELRESITIDIQKSDTSIKAIIEPKSEHAAAVETGRPSGGRPPIEAIRNWLAAKGLDDKMAFAIAKKIGESGEPANPYVQRTVDRTLNIIKGRIVTAIYMAVRASM